ncbi:GntR family transcriptional regulator [Nonomuraea ferruginea]
MVARYELIADELRGEILSGVHPVGSQLPSESELAARHGAARGTVRQAVAVLAAEGLVGSRQGGPGASCSAPRAARASPSCTASPSGRGPTATGTAAR